MVTVKGIQYALGSQTRTETHKGKAMAYERLMGMNISDSELYQQYREAMMPMLAAFGGEFGYDFEIAKTLKSKTQAPINRVFTLRFPTKSDMDAFFAQPQYQAVKAEFFDASVADVTTLALYSPDE